MVKCDLVEFMLNWLYMDAYSAQSDIRPYHHKIGLVFDGFIDGAVDIL